MRIPMTPRTSRPLAPVGSIAWLLRPEEVAQILSISRSKVYDLVNRGDLPGVKIDTATRIPLTALEDFVRARLPGNNQA
jgi:excisionase family DNA binding protein